MQTPTRIDCKFNDMVPVSKLIATLSGSRHFVTSIDFFGSKITDEQLNKLVPFICCEKTLTRLEYIDFSRT